jgi:hypothetical protein
VAKQLKRGENARVYGLWEGLANQILYRKMRDRKISAGKKEEKKICGKKDEIMFFSYIFLSFIFL